MSNRKVKLKPTFRISVIEGIFAQIFTSLGGVGSVFITRFFVMLGANSLQFGIMSAIGQFSQVFQIFGAYFTRHKTSRKKVTVDFAIAGRGIAFLFGILPFIFDDSLALWIALSFFLISVSLQAVSSNAWIAWVSDIYPLRVRGRFFSKRNQYLMIAGVLAGYIFGFIMDLFDPEPGIIALKFLNFTDFDGILGSHNEMHAYLILFIIAAAIGLYGLKVLNRQPERPKDIDEESFGEMIKIPLRDKNFRRLMGFGIWWMLAIGIGAPFWQPFMIKVLRMSIVSMMLYGTVSTIGSFIALKYWGRIIDHIGNKTTMRIIIALGSINAAIWLFAGEANWWIVLIEAFFSGIMWSGAGIITINFVLAIAPESKKQIYSAVYGAISGLAMMLTMLLSGALMPKAITVGPIFLHPEQVLFALTAIARLTAQIPISFIKERRSKSLGEVFFYVKRFAKVRTARFAWWRYK